MKYIPNFDINTRKYKVRDQFSEEYLCTIFSGIKFNLKKLCELAQVNIKVEGGYQFDIYLDEKTDENFILLEKKKNIYIVGIKNLPKDNIYFRILEVLAYGFFDYGARETITFKNFFIKEEKKSTMVI